MMKLARVYIFYKEIAGIKSAVQSKLFGSNVTEAHLLVGVKSVAVKPPMKVWRRHRMSTSAPIWA